jgi:hypothetical protein
MRKSLWVLTVLLVAISAPSAYADSATFTCLSVPCTPTPTVSVSSITPITITQTWGIFSGTYTFGPTAEATDTFTLEDSVGVASIGTFDVVELIMMDATHPAATPGLGADEVEYDGQYQSLLGNFADGNVTLSSVSSKATPEPSSVALMLAGIGFLLVMRRRLAQGHMPAR